jgi:ATP-binding cassette subfamily B protein
VDSYAEEQIIANLKPLMAKKTTIIVTHRISSIKDADHIYVFDNGEMVECGQHEDLAGQSGLYADMFRRQQIEQELERNNDQEANHHAP